MKKLLLKLLVFCSLGLVCSSQSLPTLWVDSNEGNVAISAPTYTLTFPSSWSCGTTTYGPYTAASATSLNQAIADAETCRTTKGGTPNILLKLPHALYSTSSAIGIVIPQSSTTLATGFIALVSTQDVNLPSGQTVCSHGIQDNLVTSTDIGLANPDCTGNIMYYQLGTTITSISTGALTLANGTATNTSVYNDAQYMYTLESTGTNPSSLTFCSPLGISSSSHPPLCAATTIGPDHWLIEDAEIRMQAGNTGNQFIVDLQLAGNETNIAQLASHIHLRKVWVHGDWTTLTAGANSVSSDIEFDCVYCSIVDSQVSESLRPGSEGHVITAQGKGPYKLNHNWLEGQSSSIFSGGFTSLSPFGIAGYMPFQDVEIRRNRLTFPYAWLGVMTIPIGNTHWANASVDRKNALETKNAARLLEYGNIIENSDNSGGQSGVLADWNVRQFRTNYQNTVQDVTIANNIFRNGCEGIEFANSGPSQGNGGGIAFNERRILLSNNLFYNLTPANPGCIGVLSIGLNTSNSGWIFQGTVTENAPNTAATFVPTCSASGGTTGINGGNCPGQVSGSTITAGGSGCVAGNLTISAPPAGGIQAAGTYGCTGSALSSVTITNEGLNYPSAPTATIATGTGTLTLSIYNSPGGLLAGSEVMDLSIGDPIAVYNCPSVTGFNVPLTNFTTGSFYWPNMLGPRASAVSNTIGSPSVTFPMVTTANVSDASGYCTVITTQGGPQNFSAIHNTFITNSILIPSSNNTAGPGPNFAMNFALQDNILISASGGTGWNSNRGEGHPTQIFNYDVNSLTADRNVWPGRTSSLYTAYGNNLAFPVVSPVMYFPALSYCTGSTSTSGCIGFIGAMSASFMPMTLSDYHGYTLRSDSVFHNASSDGVDIGANTPAIDAALTQNLFVCTTSCGSGPFPDISTITIVNNTSACTGNGLPTAGCNASFGSFGTKPTNAGAETPIPDPIPTNVSTIDLHSFLYPGATTRTIVHYEPWFSNTGSFNGHKNIGMNENNCTQVQAQLVWMQTIGADVVDIDYYGTAHSFELATSNCLSTVIATNPALYPTLMLTLDGGSINGVGSGQCPKGSTGDQSTCVISALNAQLDYMAIHFLYKPYYENDAATGDPVVPLFVYKTDWPDTNFTTVYTAVHAHVQAGQSCGSGCTYTKSVKLIDENAGAFSEVGIDGGFAWPQPQIYSITNQFCWDSPNCSFNYLPDFYSHARGAPSKISIGAIYKGFDDAQASWGTNRVIAQQCGSVLNLSANTIGTAGYNSSSQLQYVQFVTWNDYEEGSELETGVDNCITVGQPFITNGIISWSLIKSDATYANTSTINSFSIYTGTTGPTTLYASGISPTATSAPAPPPAAGQLVYIYMIGGPLIQNRVSPATANSPPTGTIVKGGVKVSGGASFH